MKAYHASKPELVLGPPRPGVVVAKGTELGAQQGGLDWPEAQLLFVAP